MEIDVVFQVIVLVVSVVFHEVSHGYAAVLLGDPTPRFANRLSLNPLRHIDPIGSVAIPLLLLVTGSNFLFGWAKPVPFNPYNIRHRWGEAIVALAGPASNMFLAVVLGLVLRFGLFGTGAAAHLALLAVLTNLVLAVFNLVPLPPLDGSRILLSVLPPRMIAVREFLDRYGFFLVIFFAFYLSHLLYPIVGALLSLIVGA